MKLLIVAPYFYPRVGGMENYVYNVARLLGERYDVTASVICSNWEREVHREETINGMRVYRLPYLFKVSSTPINPFWRRTISAIIRKERPHVINGHIPVPYIADIACRIAQREKIPFILTYHNDLIGNNSVLRFLSRLYYYGLGLETLRLSHRIVATSAGYARSSPYLRGFLNKLRIVPPGVVVGKFSLRARRMKGAKQVLFVGQLNRASQHKGLNYLIEAMKIVINGVSDARLVVIGTGDHANHYRNMAKTWGLEDKIEFAGYVSEEELPRYYAESSVVVLPSSSRAEGFGMVLLEAQAAGKPVVGTTVGGIPWAVKDGQTGLLVPPKDSEALAGAIIRLLEDSRFAERLGRAGRKWVTQEFTWDKSAEETFDILQETIKSAQDKSHCQLGQK